ncbi:MAG: GcvT family protein, partial [Granulosicoccaceae bacterium]
YSVDLYARLEEETGQSVGWIQKGSLSIATNPDRLIHVRRQQTLAKMFGVEAHSVSAAEAQERWPLMNADDVLGAVWSPDDGRVSPSDLCAALVKGAKRRGAQVFEDTGVVGILSEGNKIIGVETESGTISCDAIAVCAGLWSREVGAMAGVNVPLWPCEHFYLLTEPVDGIQGNMPTLSDHDAHLYIRDDSGGLLVGCFEPHARAIDPARLGPDFAFGLLEEDWDHFEPMMSKAMHRLPALKHAGVKMLLNGPESFTPDGSFMLGETAQTKGLYLGCGMNSVGVATGGGAGMALAHCIVHGHPPVDLHEADPQRFPDCFNSAEALAARAPEVLGKHYEIGYPGRQWTTARELIKLPLHERWEQSGACFNQVYGIERALYFGAKQSPHLSNPKLTFGKPPWFAQVGKEVLQAHERAALFDQSSFAKLDVHGSDACRFLNRVCTNQMDHPVGKLAYSVMLNERGGIHSDITAVRLGETHYRLFIGTAARLRDKTWLLRHILPDEQVSIDDKSDELSIIGLMGPQSLRIASELGGAELAHLPYFRSLETTLAGTQVLASRLSYVGEAGWELCCHNEDAPSLYDALVEAGAKPSGLLAQTSMRIEKGFLAYGHELDTDITPIEAGLGFCVDWDKDFIGKAALLARKLEPQKQRMVTLLLDDQEAVPLGNEAVLVQSEICGKTTSACFGYRAQRPIALALVSTDLQDGASVALDIAGEHFQASVSYRCAIDPKGSRMKQRATATA